MALAAGIAALTAFRISTLLGVIYLGICVGSTGAVLVGFCAKCPCKENCAHLIPGVVARVFERRSSPYTPPELIVVVLALSLLIGAPQSWLWRFPAYWVASLVLNAAAFVQIRLVSCRTCDNVNCPLRIEVPEMEE
jgi:hypothetical protein